MKPIPLLALVALLEDLPDRGLTRGQIGTVVEHLERDEEGRFWSSSPMSREGATP